MSRRAGDPAVGPPVRLAGGDPARPAPRRPIRARLRLACLLLLAALALPAPAAAQAATDSTSAILISQQVRYSLWRLQEGWLQWTTALFGNDEEQAGEVVDRLTVIVDRLGMEGVPDLAAGALVEAVQSARGGETERAALALEAAERLAPGRPETAFAAAEVARLAGDWPAMIAAELRGYSRLPDTALERRLALYDAAVWALASLLLAAALFVVVAMGVRGPAVARDLGRAIAGRFRTLPAPVLAAVVAAALLWPLALPSGLLWLLLYWSFLLWGYAAPAERKVLAGAWVVVVAAPFLAAEIDERVAIALSPGVRAMESAARGELYGGLFADLGVLPAALPEEPAIDHFLGDLYVRLGQWDEARRRYERVVEQEPENVTALVNLGVYYFEREDFGNAVDHFRQATEVEDGEPEERAAAWFDLSLAYADSNLFDEQAHAFSRARAVDGELVDRWGDRPDSQQIVTVAGGFERTGEVERALRERRRTPETASPAFALLRRARSALLVLLLAAAAIAAHAITRRRRSAGALEVGQDGPGRWSSALVPGLASLHAGRGWRAFLALLLAVAPVLVLLDAPGGLGYDVPWRHDPGGWLLPSLALLTLVVLLVVRIVRAPSAAAGGRSGPAYRRGG